MVRIWVEVLKLTYWHLVGLNRVFLLFSGSHRFQIFLLGHSSFLLLPGTWYRFSDDRAGRTEYRYQYIYVYFFKIYAYIILYVPGAKCNINHNDSRFCFVDESSKRRRYAITSGRLYSTRSKKEISFEISTKTAR